MSPQWEGEVELERNSASDYDNYSKTRMTAAPRAIALRGGTTLTQSVVSGKIPCGT